jgi:hypothetical protein
MMGACTCIRIKIKGQEGLPRTLIWQRKGSELFSAERTTCKKDGVEKPHTFKKLELYSEM